MVAFGAILELFCKCKEPCMQGNVFWEVFSMLSFKRVITKQKLTIGLKDNDLEYIKQTQI